MKQTKIEYSFYQNERMHLQWKEQENGLCYSRFRIDNGSVVPISSSSTLFCN
jgi:hypothetical protein